MRNNTRAAKQRHCEKDKNLKKKIPVKENDLYVNIFTVLVQEILQKVAHGLVGYVSANDNMPETSTFTKYTATGDIRRQYKAEKISF